MVPSIIEKLVLVASLLLALFMAVAGVFALLDIGSALATAHWVSTPGRVSRVETRQYSVPCTWNYGTEKSCHVVVTHNSAVEWEYSVGGTPYTAIQRFDLSMGGIFSSRAFSETARYAVGQAVTAYYNPDHPQQAVLTRDLSLFDLFIVFSAVLVVWPVIDALREPINAYMRKASSGHSLRRRRRA